MNVYRTKRLTVQAIRFDQHRKPWPSVVEPVYTNGIPEPRLEGGPVVVKNGDYILGIGATIFTLPPALFARLFEEGSAPAEDPRLAQALAEILDLEKKLADLRAAGPVGDPQVLLPSDFPPTQVLPATGNVDSNPNEGGLH